MVQVGDAQEQISGGGGMQIGVTEYPEGYVPPSWTRPVAPPPTATMPVTAEIPSGFWGFVMLMMGLK